MFFLSDFCEAKFALGKKELFAVGRALDKGAQKRLIKTGSPHKLLKAPRIPDSFGEKYGLTKMEEYALNSYKNGMYKEINSDKHPIMAYVRNKVDAGLRKLPKTPNPDKKLSRYIAVNDDELEKIMGNYKTNKKVTTRYLTSTNSPDFTGTTQAYGSKPEPGRTPIKFLIKPKANTRSRYIEGIVPTVWNESEQLFPSRTGFRTTKVNKTKKGYTINLDEV